MKATKDHFEKLDSFVLFPILYIINGEEYRMPNVGIASQHLGGNRYRLGGHPTGAIGVSMHDIVQAKPFAFGSTGRAMFERILQKSGNRTVIITTGNGLDGNATDFDTILAPLTTLGCIYDSYFDEEETVIEEIVLNIPRFVDWAVVSDYLEQKNLDWHCADPYELPDFSVLREDGVSVSAWTDPEFDPSDGSTTNVSLPRL